MNLHKYNFARENVYTDVKKGGASEEMHYFTFIALHVRSKPFVEELYNPFSTVHFRPKLEVNNVVSWSYCSGFPSNIFDIDDVDSKKKQVLW